MHLSTQDSQRLRKALVEFENRNNPRFSIASLLDRVREENYNSNTIIGIIRGCRARRQAILHGAMIQRRRHPIRSLKFYFAALVLQYQMEELFEKLYLMSGQLAVLEAIEEARFITPQFINYIQTKRLALMKVSSAKQLI